MKYAPRKVYIKERGRYVELSYTDFCCRRESDQTYMDKLFIPVQGCLLEVVREQYTDFYRDKERWRYLQKLDTKNSLLSLDGFTDSEGNPLDFIADEAADIAETVVNAVMVDRLKAALPLLSDSEQALIHLVEAKAHLTELKSKLMASSEQSKQMIVDSMRSVFNKHYSGGDFSLWTSQYYQLANRLTFLTKLNENFKHKKIQVKLVLLNFVDDYTYKPTSASEWERHYREIFDQMTGCETPPQNVSVMNFSVVGRGCARNPISGDLIFHKDKILSYGFSKEENIRIRDNLPNNCNLLVCDSFSDRIAYNGIYCFVNPYALSDDELKIILDFYNQKFYSKELSV